MFTNVNYVSSEISFQHTPSDLFVAGATETPAAPAVAGVDMGDSPAANEKLRILEYKVLKDLKECVDSMLFDSDTTIAHLIAESKTGLKVDVSLMVRGAVSVEYKGKTYRKPSEFPQELIDRIKAKPNDWLNPSMGFDPENLTTEQLNRISALLAQGIPDDYFEEDDIYVSCNNWFEYIYEVSGNDHEEQDGILFEADLAALTEEALQAEMLAIATEIIEEVE